jgi:hypothetical protein
MARTLNLDKKISVEIAPIAPFNFDATVYKSDHFPTPDHIWEDIFWQRKEGKKIPWLEKEIRL